jgi:2-keto-4-pentenoate hydratase
MSLRAAELARTLAERHAARATFTSIFDEGEASVDLAYDVQDHYVAGLLASGETPAGYKVGLTTKRMQALCGVDEPIAGVALASRIHAAPCTVRVADYVRLGVESEMAVRIGPSVGERAMPEDLPLSALVDQVCASFELVEDSGADYKRLSAASIVADNGWNAGLVFGAPVPIAAFEYLRGRRGVLRLNGEQVNEGMSDEVLGDPLEAVHWLARHLRHRGGALKPGDWVSTGAICPTRFVHPGETYVFELDGLPPTELRLA